MIGTRPLTDSESNSLMEHLTDRDKTLFYLGLKTGFRIQELLSIEIKDLYEHNGTLKNKLTVSRKNMKGKISGRCVPISNETIANLNAYIRKLPRLQKYLFQSQKGSKLSRIQAYRVIKDASIRAGLTGKIACHSMRKSFANKVYHRLDKDLVKTQRAMGHKSVNSTVSYISFLDTEIDEAILD